MRVAWFGPLPPVRSGIAHYATLLLPRLSERHELVCVTDQREPAQTDLPVISPAQLTRELDRFDAVYCQIGNNPYHEGVYRWALEHPSIVVIHDLVLHHLIVEMTLARGDAEGYVEAMRKSHGEAGAAWARGRAAGAHGEIGNFLFPAFRELASRARHVIVHNSWAASRITSAGVTTPVTVAGHPWVEPEETGADRVESFRRRFGLPEGRIVAMLGFVTAAKRPAEVFRAFAEAAERDPALHLVVAGQPGPGVDLESIARVSGLVANRWTATGYLTDDEFDAVVQLADRVVNLRYPTAGETSGPLIRVVGAGRSVAVSDYAQFGDMPEGTVVKIPFGEAEHRRLVDFILGDLSCDRDAQLAWVRKTCAVDAVVDAYERGARGDGEAIVARTDAAASIALFVEWRVEHAVREACVDVRLTLVSDNPVVSARWGTPGYRVIGDVELESGKSVSRWYGLAADVTPGDAVDLRVSLPSDWRRLSLRHGLEGVPDVTRPPFAIVERRDV